jgi:ATP-dependent DNA helicase PIF1
MDKTTFSDFDRIKNAIENGQNIILHGPGGVGKCLSPETKVLLYNGSVKDASKLTLEDVLMGDDSTPRIISSIYSGIDDMYKILSSNGDYFVCNSKHILSLYNPTEKNIVDIDLQDYMKKYKKWRNNHFLFQRAVNFQEKNIKIDPYFLGTKIGSGETYIDFDGFAINLNLGIPRAYITTGAQYRMSLLKGIIDSNGFYHREHVSISSNCDALLQSIKFLATSLGYESKIVSCELLITKTFQDIIYNRFSIIPLGKDEYVGFTIDSNARFLLGNLIVTHNSYLIKNIALEFMGKVACTATTGIAAINLSQPGLPGSTLHSWAGVGLADQPLKKIVAKIQHDDRSKKRWLQTTILIIDEISMLGALFFDKLDYIGKEIRRNHAKPFGGLQLILCGDFLQLPPVNDKWAFESYVWIELNLAPFILETPKRYKDVNWFSSLLRFRKGVHNDQDIELLRNRAQAYETYMVSSSNKLDEVKPTILYAKKVDVAYQNDAELQKLPGPQQEYISIDTFQSYSTRARLDFYMTPLEETIPKAIYLKQGAQVMLKYNLDLENGLANGSRGVVTRIFPENVEIKWLNGNITLVSRVTWIQEDKDGKATRTQIPLILAWSITCHRAQGSTLDFAVCDLGPSIFCDGQAYVSISRVRSSDGLFLSDFYPPSIKVNQKALEYVKSIEKPKPLLRLNFRGTPEHLVDCFICDAELMECHAIKKGRNFFCLKCSRKI